MRTFFAFVILLLLGIAIYVYTRDVDPVVPEPTPPIVEEERLISFSSDEYGISFTYPEEYELSEMNAPGSEVREHYIITLIRKEDLPPPQGGEGPPAITIDIIQNNLDNRDTEEWIRGDSRSNFKLGEMRLSTTSVSGMQAFSYRWSGLYEGTTVAIARPNWIYAFSVTYLELGADIVQDFVTVRDSVRLQ
ncbi:MAG: hypothetical protein WA021_04180 [Minisyncoccia bacterium]